MVSPLTRPLRTDEIIHGVKKADWTPPQDWGDPFEMPPHWYKGILVKQLIFPNGLGELQHVETEDD